MTRTDNHLHTTYSDGKDSPRNMILAALELGYEQITFTDHVTRDSSWLDDYILELSGLKQEFAGKIIIQTGVEAKIINLRGDIDFDDAYRNKLDVVLAAMHRIPIGEKQYLRSSEVTPSNKENAYRCMKEAFRGALKNQYVDILAHPFQLGAVELLRPFFSEEYCRLLRNIAVQEEKYLEFNTNKYNGCVNQDYWLYPNLKVWTGSDSHSAEDMKKIS